MSNPFSPGEVILTFYEDSFYTLGMNFDPAAPYAGCRLCGEVYQTQLDRDTFHFKEEGLLWFNELEQVWEGSSLALSLKERSDERRTRWRMVHRRRYHTDREVEQLHKSGLSVTPEAAHKLAPYGFAPSENRSEEIVDAMATAPRAPIKDTE